MTVTALSIALAAGVLSFLSPCIVPMLSVYFTMITGESFRSLRDMSAAEASRKGVLRNTLAFVAGFSLVFTAAGALAAQVGQAAKARVGAPRVAELLMIGLGVLTVSGKLTLLTAAISRLLPYKLPIGM